MAQLALLVVIANAVVLLVHDGAHRELGVLLGPWQKAFVYGVIVPGPIVALFALRRAPRAGYALLGLAMLGSLLFGAYHHYVAISPDHVDHLPAGSAQATFRLSAALMVAIEAAGVGVALLGLRAQRRSSR